MHYIFSMKEGPSHLQGSPSVPHDKVHDHETEATCRLDGLSLQEHRDVLSKHGKTTPQVNGNKASAHGFFTQYYAAGRRDLPTQNDIDIRR